jgi:hypothetical protein
MKRMDRKRLEALQKVLDMAQVFSKDVEIASEQLLEILKNPPKPSRSTTIWDVPYVGKTALRNLFGHVDGVAYTMRSIALEFAEELKVPIPDEERRALQEQRGTKDGKPAQNRPSPLEHLKIAFRYFPTLFGIEAELDLSSEHAKAFLDLAEIRKEIAHPKTLEQLTGKDVYDRWIPGSAWYLAQISGLFLLCAQQIPENELNLQKPELPDYQHAERVEVVEPSSLLTLEPLQKAFEVLVGDTSRAMGVSTKMAGKDDLQATYGQFGLRNLVRTVFSELETTLAITSFVLSSSFGRSELALSDEDYENLRVRGDVDRELMDVANLWSMELGDQTQKALGSKKWDMFRQALRIRDRLLHPRAPKDLRVSLDETSTTLGAQDFLREFTLLFSIEEEKWPKAAPEPPLWV